MRLFAPSAAPLAARPCWWKMTDHLTLDVNGGITFQENEVGNVGGRGARLEMMDDQQR